MTAAGEGFRARLRAIARARAAGELKPGDGGPAAATAALTPADVWPAVRAEGFWLGRPGWPEGYPRPPAVNPDIPAALAFDVESLGRTPQPLFLVGFVTITAGAASFEQLFAAHPDEEGAVVTAAAARLAAADLVLSYNGRTFDLPILRDRLAWWRLPFQPPARHVDLLHVVRRHYRSRLGMPNCGLAETERWLLGFERPDDVPSNQVPALYERSLQAGDPRPLVPVLRHNLYDLAAMALIYLKAMGEVPTAFAPPKPQAAAADAALF